MRHDDQYLLAIGHGNHKIYKVSDWSLVQSLKTDQFVNFASGVFSPDGQYVIGVGSTKEARGNVFLWDFKSGKLLKQFIATGLSPWQLMNNLKFTQTTCKNI